MKRIPIAGPSITQKEVAYVADAAKNAWYENANSFNDRFEKAFARFLGVKYAVSLPSCTSAIHLALLAVGVGPGDEVIVPDITWIASAAPVTYVGSEIVFADVDLDSWCLCPKSLEACITPNTKAVIPVDLYGNFPEMDSLLQVAQNLGVLVIEDAAEAIGSKYKGKQAGSLGEVGVFSFHGSKTLTTGEGGMLVTDSETIKDRVLFLRDHGRQPGDRMFQCTEVAYKYKMSSMQAAMGLAQLERIQELILKKQQIFAWYKSKLDGVQGIQLNSQGQGIINTYWMVTVVWDDRYPVAKEELMARMDEKSIDTRPIFSPLSSIPAFNKSDQAKAARTRNQNAYAIGFRGINLPCGMDISENQVDYICNSLEESLNEV